MSRGRSHRNTTPPATRARIGVRDAVAMTPIRIRSVGTHQTRRSRPCECDSEREGHREEHTERDRVIGRPDRTNQLRTGQTLSTLSNCRNGKTLRTWSKTLNPVRCSTIAKNATTATPDTMNFVTTTTPATLVTTLAMK